MRKLVTIILVLSSVALFAQVEEIANFNTSSIDPADSNRAWEQNVNHVRTIHIAGDLDQDGKNEILATDYSLGGRVHVLEYNEGILELVWSSPVREGQESGSTPRWVRSGDLDGDGNKEIIFSVNTDGADGEIQVWEWDGADNSFGTQPIIDFPADLFAAQGAGNFRTNREQGWVYDFDGDGVDELIMANRDQKVYILSINGNAPGFASWIIEAGLDSEAQSGGSWWQSLPVDYDGDGVKEIVNHYWNFNAFWSIEPTGPNAYTYPSGTNSDGGVSGPIYFEYMKNINEDGVSFMGVHAVDVDGDGNEEIFGSNWVGGGSSYNYTATLVDVGGAEAAGVEVWNSQDQFTILKDSAWTEIGLESAEYWGNGVADLNENGTPELLLGGVPGTILTALEYNGSGSIMDGDNYTAEKIDIFSTLPGGYDHYDSSGVAWIDTLFVATQYFIAKTATGDLTGNGKENVVLGYQTVPDSLEYTFYVWEDSVFVIDSASAYMEFNTNAINVRVLEANATGVKQLDMKVISPNDYVLEQNYPNPFNPTTNIRFSLPVSKEISLIVYDMLGREVKTLLAGQELASGSYEATWDGTNNFGHKVASGNYIYTLKYGNFKKSVKMTLLK